MNTQPPVTCREVRQALPAFIHRELPAAQRSRVGRHLDTCAACHIRYTRERELSQSLSSAMPLIGRGAEAGRFEMMWREIASEIASQIALRRRQIDTRRLMTSGAALLAVVLLAMAWTPTTSVAGVPTQPTAAEKEAFSTPVAAALLVESAASATLTPPLQGNYAPGAAATDEPEATSGT